MSKISVFTRSELAERLLLVNNFRLALGFFFFAYFAALGFLRLTFSPGTEAVLFLGLFLFTYSLLTQYFLKTQKMIAMVEIVFLSVFITLLDIVLITLSIYFTGGGENPFFVFYLLSLLMTAFIFPYYRAGLFIWLAATLVFYEGQILMTLNGSLPIFPRFLSDQINPAISGRIIILNALGVPLVLLGACLAVYFISGYLLKERHLFKKILVEEETAQQEFAAISNISWILTRLQDLDYMLEKVLEETFKLLKLHSGSVLVVHPKNAHYHKRCSIGVPTAVNNFLSKLKPGRMPSEEDRNFGSLLKDEGIESFVAKPLLAPGGTYLGMIVFFIHQGETPSKRGLFNLDAIVNELGIVLAYALFIEKLKPRKRKK
ncbi:hypothetical protein HZC35_04475 [Candidatus Saganbacteria bacterium]|nr:hypothetical protein [Candidatus Saganbacteria bacterium]